MSTRSTTHFKWGADEDSTAIIYRHPDGYPSGHGQFLIDFLDDIKANVSDTRFSDPSYLAARLVVALAREFNTDYKFVGSEVTHIRKDHPLDFISVGVVSEDPGDIAYRYEVICDMGTPHASATGLPLVLVYERTGDWGGVDLEWKLIGNAQEAIALEAQERV